MNRAAIPGISVRHASLHNLCNLSCDIPRRSLMVFSGPSGAGKSSLLFDVIGSEARRRVESLTNAVSPVSASRHDVRGLSAPVELSAHALRRRKDIVGTVLGVWQPLIRLFLRHGVPHCTACGEPIRQITRSQILRESTQWDPHAMLSVVLPYHSESQSSVNEDLKRAVTAGITRVVIATEARPIEEVLPFIEFPFSGDLVIDRFRLGDGGISRLAEAITLGESVARSLTSRARSLRVIRDRDQEFEIGFEYCCHHCGAPQQELSPEIFSLRRPFGVCAECDGAGVQSSFRKESIEDDNDTPSSLCSACGGTRLPPQARAVRLRGRSVQEILSQPVQSVHAFFDSDLFHAPEEGGELRGEESGSHVTEDPDKLLVGRRLRLLRDLDLAYLSLSRGVRTLSAGEFGRLRLAGAIHSEHEGLLYLLDEPTAGLHPLNISFVVAALRLLVERGNSVLLVDHARELMEKADYILELGPGAAGAGGRVVAEGAPHTVRQGETATGHFLRGAFESEVGATPHSVAPSALEFRGVRLRNLQIESVHIPMGSLVVIAGVSGSGKSTLVFDALAPALHALTRRRRGVDHGRLLRRLCIDEVLGWEGVRRVIAPRLSPTVGRNRWLLVAHLSGLMPIFQELYAATVEAKMFGLTPQFFSLGTQRGRCERCRGAGVEVGSEDPCISCSGSRFGPHVSRVRVHDLTLPELLDRTVAECAEEFPRVLTLHERCRRLAQVGLGYLRLSQPGSTLSGGELQRLRLARALENGGGGALLALDEPTRGLFPGEIGPLVDEFRRFVRSGNTVVVIDHNRELLRRADHIVEIGPGAGDAGGAIVAEGTPGELKSNPRSIIAPYLSTI